MNSFILFRILLFAFKLCYAVVQFCNSIVQSSHAVSNPIFFFSNFVIHFSNSTQCLFLLVRSFIDPTFCGIFVCGPLQF